MVIAGAYYGLWRYREHSEFNRLMKLRGTGLQLNVFGREVLVQRGDDHWQVYYLGAEGKKRRANDIVVPADISIQEIPDYIADLCHEWASPRHNSVILIWSSENGTT